MTVKVRKVRQSFERPVLGDVAAATRAQASRIIPKITSGSSVAIAVGSRGIANIAQIVKSVVDVVLGAGGKPYIVPAMGSHAGATAEGQAALLDSYGISSGTMGVAVVSSMEVCELENCGLENRVFVDNHAWEADQIIVINRIKPHTDYHSSYESGLAKMLVIGLGKHAQALEIHRYGVRGLREMIPATARHILSFNKVLAGLAIVENAYDETAHVEMVESSQIMDREPQLLEMARRNMPKLPVDDIDILIIDRMGKDISGVGIDPNIIGRMMIRGEPEPVAPRIKCIIISDLTERSHGNALGTGLADVITRRLFDKIKFADVYENVYTSTFLERAKVPVVAETDLRAFQYALRSCGSPPDDGLRVIRIEDTLHLGELYVSESVARELDGSQKSSASGSFIEPFDAEGMLVPF